MTNTEPTRLTEAQWEQVAKLRPKVDKLRERERKAFAQLRAKYRGDYRALMQKHQPDQVVCEALELDPDDWHDGADS